MLLVITGKCWSPSVPPAGYFELHITSGKGDRCVGLHPTRGSAIQTYGFAESSYLGQTQRPLRNWSTRSSQTSTLGEMSIQKRARDEGSPRLCLKSDDWCHLPVPVLPGSAKGSWRPAVWQTSSLPPPPPLYPCVSHVHMLANGANHATHHSPSSFLPSIFSRGAETLLSTT